MRKYIFLIIAISVLGTLFYWTILKKPQIPAQNADEWVIYRASKNNDVKIYTSPRPARKFIHWNGKLYIATAGGLFPFENDELLSPLTTADGLPSHNIRDALHYGSNIIVATDNGFAIIEPNTRITCIENVKNHDSNRINALTGNRKIVLATDCGLFAFDGDNIEKIADGCFKKIIEISSGFIAADTSGSIYRISGKNISKICTISQKISDIACYESNIFAATSRGCLKIDFDGHNIDTVRTTEPMTTMVKFFGETLFVAGFYGCDIFVDNHKIRTIGIPQRWGGIRDIVNFDERYLFCGDGGIIDDADRRLDENCLPSNRITAICKFDGEIWAGTFSSGLVHFDSFKWKSNNFRISPFINSLATDGAALWVGTDDGLARIGENVRIFGKKQGLNSNHITSIFYDGKYLWVTTNRGVCRSEKFGWRQYFVSDGLCGDHTYSIFSRNDDCWIATYGGVSEISSTKSRCFRRADGALKNDWATAVAISSDGVFIGTYGGGISRYTDEQWNFYEKDVIINPNAVALWNEKPVFGTAGDGILLWDGLNFIHLTRKNCLPSDEILSIFADGDYIWVGTTNGLCKFAPKI